MVLFPPPFFYISNLLSYIQNNFSYELARPIMGTIFLVYNIARLIIEHHREWLASLADYILWYVQILFLEPIKKAERNFEIAARTLCLRVCGATPRFTAEDKIPLPRQHFSSRILLDRKLSESYFF